MHLLLASPVRQPPPVLRHFLAGLASLHTRDLHLDFAFVDDNDDPAASALLSAFAPSAGTVTLLPAPPSRPDYRRDDRTHAWDEQLVWRVAAHKDRLLQLALDQGYDAVFFVDSDLVLHPATLRHLVTARVDIVSEVFWTRWLPDGPELPNAWLQDHYTLLRSHRDEPELPPDERDARITVWLAELRTPGVHEVGGLGACTLIRRAAIEAGCRFAPIPNLSWTGEDRHFCVRAAALGFPLYADTHAPPLHLYREEDLDRVESWRASWAPQQKRTEAIAFLQEALRAWGSKHHRTWTGLEGLDAFAPELRAGLADSASDRAVGARAGEVVTRLELPVAWVEDLGPQQIRLVGVAAMRGREGEIPVHQAAEVRAELVREGEALRISELSLAPSGRPPPPVPFLRRCSGNRITLAMLVRDEADRYLRDVLSQAARLVDEAVILDDASTDGTPELCEELLAAAGLPHQVVRLDRSGFGQEWRVRRLLWELVAQRRPDWILCLDADELIDDCPTHALRSLVDQSRHDVVAFRLFDMWDTEHYRDDPLWTAHRRWWPLLVRWSPDTPERWPEAGQHCGRWPVGIVGIADLPALRSPLRIKHLGWMRAEDRRAKYERYQQLDPGGRWGDARQYESILDPEPYLVPFAAQEKAAPSSGGGVEGGRGSGLHRVALAGEAATDERWEASSRQGWPAAR